MLKAAKDMNLLKTRVGPSLVSSSRLELFFRLEVNKLKARARSSLKSQSSDELFAGSKRLEGLKNLIWVIYFFTICIFLL